VATGAGFARAKGEFYVRSAPRSRPPAAGTLEFALSGCSSGNTETTESTESTENTEESPKRKCGMGTFGERAHGPEPITILPFSVLSVVSVFQLESRRQRHAEFRYRL
jgi:hypothetical protein